MAPLPIIEKVTRVAFEWTPLPMVNVMHFHQDTLDHPALWNIIKNNVTQNMWTHIATTQKIASLNFTPLDGHSPSIRETTDGTGKWSGIKAGDPIVQMAAVLSLKTAFRGRSNRGRVFLGPVGESGNTAGMLDPASITQTLTAWTAFQTALIAGNTQHVVCSYKAGTALTVLQYTQRQAGGTVRKRQSRLA